MYKLELDCELLPLDFVGVGGFSLLKLSNVGVLTFFVIHSHSQAKRGVVQRKYGNSANPFFSGA